jgi:ketosteroid isomerase-like protein
VSSTKHPALNAALPATPDDCEAQFYEALQQANLERLLSLWADEDEIACIHPGGLRLVGATTIRASFAEIFAHGAIDCRPAEVRKAHVGGAAVHTLTEIVRVQTAEGSQLGHVLASNVYVRTPMGWRIVLHHASPGMVNEAGGTQRDSNATLH